MTRPIASNRADAEVADATPAASGFTRVLVAWLIFFVAGYLLGIPAVRASR